MPDKPDFIVDPTGRAQDVRGQKNAPAPHPDPTPYEPIQRLDRSPGSRSGSSGGVIIIPIGLVVSLICAILRMTANNTPRNTYPEWDVNTLEMGLYYYDQGEYERALLQFNLTIGSQPEMGEAYNDRGLAYYALGQTENALADFNRAIELLPNPSTPYNNRGGLYYAQGNYELALADLNRAIELSPGLAKAFHGRGLTYLELGNYEQAIDDLTQAIELTPEDIFSMQATLESRQTQNRSVFGGGFVESMLNRGTYADLPSAYASRAMAYLQQGDPQRAAADLERARQLGLDPGFGELIQPQLPTAAPPPQIGRWAGVATQAGYQGAVTFEISDDGQIHDFQLDLFFSEGNACQIAVTAVQPRPDGTFAFNYGIHVTPGGNLVEGTFKDPTSVAGSFGRHIECVSTTGEQLDGELSAGTVWSAEWISGPGIVPTPSSGAAPTIGSESPSVGQVNITSLAVNPTQPLILYIGSWGIVYRSRDGGQHWQAVPDGLPDGVILSLVVDPLRPEVVYAGTSEGLFQSTNSGESWEAIYSDPIYLGIPNLVIDPVSPEKLYVGTLTGVYVSQDGGRTWASLGSDQGLPPIDSLAIDPRVSSTLYAGTAVGVWKTTDGGLSWQSFSAGLPESDVRIVAVDPATPGTVYAGTGQGLYKSTDQGLSWSRSFWSSPTVSFAFDPHDPNTIYINQSGDGMLRSPDGGANWFVIYGIQTPLKVNVMVPDPLTPGALYVGTTQGVYRLTEGGAQWEALSVGLSH